MNAVDLSGIDYAHKLGQLTKRNIKYVKDKKSPQLWIIEG